MLLSEHNESNKCKTRTAFTSRIYLDLCRVYCHPVMSAIIFFSYPLAIIGVIERRVLILGEINVRFKT